MKLIIITGQTATGKTSLACKLAAEQNGELINCDSRQIYKHLSIITGKDTGDARFQKVRTLATFDIGYYQLQTQTPTNIWLYDIVDPKTFFSSHDYRTCALEVIKDILHRGKTPILVGGTYFYIQHLLYDMTKAGPPDWSLRTSLSSKTIDELQDILQKKSLAIYQSLNNSELNNPQRLIRKIEIVERGEKDYFTQNQTITLLQTLGINEGTIECRGLYYESKEKLREAIVKRTHERVKQGAFEEVQSILKRGYTDTDPGLKTIGYTQIIQYLKGEITQEEAIDAWITREVQYAKRQRTFMKKDLHIQWTDV